MNEKGEVVEEAGLIVPDPFSMIVTLVALPPNIFPLTVTGEIPQVLPLIDVSDSVGGLAHPHDTRKLAPVTVHPPEFFTVIVWLPLATFTNTLLLWYVPASILYSYPDPVGYVTVTTAFP